MEIWAVANVYTAAAPSFSTSQLPSETVAELPRICTWATEGDASTTTVAHTTALPNTLVPSHRFWNASFDYESSNASIITSLTTTTSGGNVEPSWTYHKPTLHTTATIPVSATAAHGASCSRFAIFVAFFLSISLWDRLR
ncbi:hypothetical protein CDEST_01928 [Colletotrichum destructivum]|uniref:Uncharacterized protein n=1 Tax=Colletotrichum destructivum TaxID=34406 RepID=A0AAX4I1H6_9PEZI|nr:hypothetical protein CDEST_01928 [Colletotrichum destructivum]